MAGRSFRSWTLWSVFLFQVRRQHGPVRGRSPPAEPLLHHVEDADQLLLPDDIGDHGVHVLQEGAAEHATVIGKLLEALQRGLVIHLHTGAAAHDPDLADSGIGKAQHLPLGDGLDAVIKLHF